MIIFYNTLCSVTAIKSNINFNFVWDSQVFYFSCEKHVHYIGLAVKSHLFEGALIEEHP